MRVLVLVLVAGCTAGTTPDSPTESTADPSRFSVEGTLLDLDGGSIEDAFVTVSTDFCIPDRTAPDGTFEVGEVDPGSKRLITYGETAANGLFASVAFAFEADDQHVFGRPILLPELVETHPVDPSVDQVIETADDLTLAVDADTLTLAPFAPSEIQVARVPVEDAPPVVPDEVDLVDLFVLHPILSTIDPPAAVTFPVSDLPPGTQVTIHALDYDLGTLVPVAEGVVDDGGRPTTLPGDGIPELTWIGLSEASQ